VTEVVVGLLSPERDAGMLFELARGRLESVRLTEPLLVRNIDWFRFWLQGYEDPNPVKKQQYAHWREMRVAGPTRSARGSARSGS
jgi:hypothetical protein